MERVFNTVAWFIFVTAVSAQSQCLSLTSKFPGCVVSVRFILLYRFTVVNRVHRPAASPAEPLRKAAPTPLTSLVRRPPLFRAHLTQPRPMQPRLVGRNPVLRPRMRNLGV